MADIVIISPRFEVSYWGMEHALPFFGKRANLPIAALPLLAALTPAGHTITLMDENVTPIDYKRCAKADIVGLTGMIVQRTRMREILLELKRRDCFTVVGGPWVTVNEKYFGNLADVTFIGEAEDTWPQFLREWQNGQHAARYEQAEKTDMTTLPVPRLDLLPMRDYAIGSVQFSRGCPFQCEFCDIIVIFGRRPRLKTSWQIIAELDALHSHGMDAVFIVDDNLIGNKKAIKEVLRDVVAWQERHGYPITFFTEASIDLADDEGLMALMVDANIRFVFVGIETPNEASLKETKKTQNLRRGGSLIEKVHRIQRFGMEVWCGMILGFDNDDRSIFDAQRRFIKDARIVNAMIGMLSAIPKTPLYTRLLAEGRLDPDDQPAFGTNVIPRQLSREELRDGYLQVLADLAAPDAYFGRFEELYQALAQETGGGADRFRRQHPLQRWRENAQLVLESGVLFLRLMRGVPERRLRQEYRRRLWQFLKRRPAPRLLQSFAIKCAMHYHALTMARDMASGDRAIVNSI